MSSSTTFVRKSEPDPRKMSVKRLFESVNLNDFDSRSDRKLPKLSAVRSFPEKCGSLVRDENVMTRIRHLKPEGLSKSDIKAQKIVVRVEQGGSIVAGSNPRQSDLKLGNGTQYVAIPAVPLKSVSPIDFMSDSEMSLPSLGNDDTIPLKAANHSSDETWKLDYDKFTTILAQAKEYLDTPSDKNSVPNGTNESVEVENEVKGKKCSRSMSMSDEEDIIILSPEEWNMKRLHSERQSDGAKSSKQKTKSELVEMSSHKVIGEQKNTVEIRGKETVDLVDVESNQQCSEVSDCEVTKTSFGERMDEFESEQSKNQYETSENYESDECGANGESSHAGSNYEPEYKQNHNELINPSIVQNDQPKAVEVREALKLFEQQYIELFHKANSRGSGKDVSFVSARAATLLKNKGAWVRHEKPFGHIPGVEIGDKFRFRAELAVAGLHYQLVSGIDHVLLDGKKFATSIVNSGRYDNKTEALDVLIYSGQGGNSKLGNVDQKLEKGNLALVHSMEMGYPVRVTHKIKSSGSKSSDFSDEANLIYSYDGLYAIKRQWKQRDKNHKMVFKFELHRLPNQRRPLQRAMKSRESALRKEVRIIDDVSNGMEELQIHAMNAVDNDRPLPFIYITKIVYPDWFKPIDPVGCECVDGCSDSRQCVCVLRNGGEIPYNEKGAIIKAKPLVHECGPSCKCPPTCMNRVSQHGPRYQLELFKTKSRGWGIRSPHFISSGNFICEYVGELLQDKEAEQRVGHDEYLFDICDSDDEDGRGEFEGFTDSKPNENGFAIDAAKYGNVGRFINHSCSPNLYAQEVLYNHDDKRMPHIMFFTTKNILPLHELTYDYNYKIDKVCDVNGDIKKKDCYCGTRQCTGRLY